MKRKKIPIIKANITDWADKRPIAALAGKVTITPTGIINVITDLNGFW